MWWVRERPGCLWELERGPAAECCLLGGICHVECVLGTMEAWGWFFSGQVNTWGLGREMGLQMPEMEWEGWLGWLLA